MEEESKTEESEFTLKDLGIGIIIFGILVFLEVSTFNIFGNATHNIYESLDSYRVIGEEKYYASKVESYMYIFSGLLIIGGLGTVLTAMRDEEKKKQDKK